MTTAPKMLIIGLDGATFKIIKPLIEVGRLPNIARLIGEGASGNLRAQTPPITPVCWTSFMTGKNPGKHAIFDFVQMREGEYAIEFLNGGFRRSETVWRYLSELGHRVGLLNIPFTYPPEEVNGFMVSGFDAPVMDRRVAHPPELFDEIMRDIGNYSLWNVGKKGATFKRELGVAIGDTTAVSEYLLGRVPVDLFMVVYSATDQVQHFYLSDEVMQAFVDRDRARLDDDLIADIYERVDTEIGKLLRVTGSDTVVILMSDHGATPIRKAFYLDRWLAEKGYLVYKPRERERPHRRTLQYGVNLAKLILTQYLPRSIQDRVLRSKWKSRLQNARREYESYRIFSTIDWSRTCAYPIGRSGGIRINLQGREPEGIVTPDRFDATCEQIRAASKELRDEEDGSHVISEVRRPDDLYHGDHLGAAPDLILSTTDCRYIVRQSAGLQGPVLASQLSTEWGPLDILGTHDMDGILVLNGKNIRAGATVTGARLEDVAPTMLYLLGKPIPEEMDGQVLSESIEPRYLVSHQVKYRAHGKARSAEQESSYSPEEEEVIRQRLSDLGYLD